jgi:hypothetical protein
MSLLAWAIISIVAFDVIVLAISLVWALAEYAKVKARR